MDPIELSTARLWLRAWRSGDEAVLLEVGADPEAQRWTSLPVPYTPEHARRYVHETAPAGWADGRDRTWAVCDLATGEVLADVALRPTGPEHMYDVGFWCRPAARGHGVVAEAIQAVCRWAFHELGAVRVEWSTQAGNWASRRAAEKAGFRFEGVLRAGVSRRGTPVDGWVAALLPGDPLEDTARFPSYPPRSDGAVTLRRWRVSDAAHVARACDDAETARWLPVPSPYTEADGLAFVDGTVPAQWFDGKAANIAVTDFATGHLLGAVNLMLRGGIGEIGYWTAPWARGRGVATRACRLHAGWGFDELGLPRMELLTDVRNTASQRVARAACFTREGVARAVRPVPRGDARADMIVWSLLPGDA